MDIRLRNNETQRSEPVRSNKTIKILSYLVLLGLVTLGWNFIKDGYFQDAFDNVQEGFSENEIVNTTGNTVGNIVNGGLVAQQEDWIYHSNLQENGHLYKKSSDGANITKLNSDNS